MENYEDLKWICEICAQSFDIEVDLLAHQFNSSCEKDLEERHNRYYPNNDGTGSEALKGGTPSLEKSRDYGVLCRKQIKNSTKALD